MTAQDWSIGFTLIASLFVIVYQCVRMARRGSEA